MNIDSLLRIVQRNLFVVIKVDVEINEKFIEFDGIEQLRIQSIFFELRDLPVRG